MEAIPTESRPTPSPDRPLNINTAVAEDLDLLPGIGPSKAAAIIDYREKHGDFKRKEDIQNVPGIGPAIFEQINGHNYNRASSLTKNCEEKFWRQKWN